MGSGDAIKEIYFHDDARKSIMNLGLDAKVLAATLAATWRTRITSGSKVKALRDVPGTDYRMRLGKFRAVFSMHEDAAFLHMIEPRDRVYERDAFDEVLRRFYASASGKGLPRGVREMGYKPIAFSGTAPSGSQHDPEWFASIGYLLRPSQQFFFNKVLPLEGSLSQVNPRLVIGHGPPGSGKTVVGIELALESVMDGHRVDILVPSRSLKGEYARLLGAGGRFVAEKHDDAPGIRVLRFDEYFARRAGRETGFDREAQALGWAQAALAKPEFIARAGKTIDREKAMEELPVLIDVLLEDDAWWRDFDVWRERSKDPLVASVEPYLGLLGGMRDALLDLLDETDDMRVTRAALANSPYAISATERRARLTVVDEAQDLAPAEWRALLQDAFNGADAEDRRIVLLGDMQQRVSRVPFSWDDIKNFATGECGLPTEQIADLEVDKASYRMKRNIGRAARAAFDKRVHAEGAFRRTSTLELDRLPDGGGIRVAVVAEGTDPLSPFLASTEPRKGEYLFVVQGRGIGSGLAGRPDVIGYSIREAKGLEADRVVIQLPFGPRLTKNKAARLAHDNATEFYTAFSRARDQVLLVVDDAGWDVLRQAPEAWEGAEIRRGSEVTRTWLASTVDTMRIGLSPEQVVKARLEQLRAIAASPTAEVTGAAEKAFIALHDLARFPQDETVHPLLEIGVTLASGNAKLHTALRDRYRQQATLMGAAERITVLCLLGELALAAELAASSHGNRNPAWDPLWLSLVCEESPMQRLRGLRLNSGGTSDWTDEAFEKLVVRSCVEALERSLPGTPPRVNIPELDEMISTSPPNAPEFAADALALRHVVETLSKIRSRIDEAERRANDHVDHVARKHFGDLAAALKKPGNGNKAARTVR
jgi:hypothetical protein